MIMRRLITSITIMYFCTDATIVQVQDFDNMWGLSIQVNKVSVPIAYINLVLASLRHNHFPHLWSLLQYGQISPSSYWTILKSFSQDHPSQCSKGSHCLTLQYLQPQWFSQPLKSHLCQFRQTKKTEKATYEFIVSMLLWVSK